MNTTAEAVTTSSGEIFLNELAKQYRAQDTYGTWDGKSNDTLLDPLHHRQRKAQGNPHHGRPRPGNLVAPGIVL